MNPWVGRREACVGMPIIGFCLVRAPPSAYPLMARWPVVQCVHIKPKVSC